MTVRIRSGSAHLVHGVRKYFEDNDVTAVVLFGDRALTTQIQGPGQANRVIFCPFDPKSGDAGTLQEPLITGPRDVTSSVDPTVRTATVRALFDWERLFIVSVWAFEPTQQEDELAQQTAVEDLLEDTAQAVHVTGFQAIALGKIATPIQGERRFGRELRFALKLTHPLFDRPTEVGHPGFEIDK